MTDSFDPAHEAPLVSPWTPSLEQHAATVRKALEKGRAAVTRYPSGIRADYFDASVYALDEIVALAREGAALRAVAAQPHAPADGIGTDGAVHVYESGHPMGCPICQAIETGLA